MSVELNIDLINRTLNTFNKTHRRRHTGRKGVVTKMSYNQAVQQQDAEAALEIDAWARRAVAANGFGDCEPDGILR